MSNAIIMAAGLGSRLKEYTKTTHKSLFLVDNVANLERTIRYLNEIGIDEIHIVVGYLSEQFLYLKDKYKNINLIFNPDFATKNNAYSFKLAMDYFSDSFIIDADVVLLKNIFSLETRSTYYTTLRRKTQKAEWIVCADEKDRVFDIKICTDEKPSLLGISYFTNKDSKIIKNEIYNLDDDYFLDSKLYYDNVIAKLIDKISIYSKFIDPSYVCELDDIKDIDELKEKLNGKFSRN